MWNNSIFINVHGFIILFWCNLFTMLREAMCFSCLWLNRDSGWNYYSLIIHCTVWWGATGCIPWTVMLQWASLFAMILMIYNTCANLSFIGFLFLYFLGAVINISIWWAGYTTICFIWRKYIIVYIIIYYEVLFSFSMFSILPTRVLHFLSVCVFWFDLILVFSVLHLISNASFFLPFLKFVSIYLFICMSLTQIIRFRGKTFTLWAILPTSRLI